jgi:retinol dehydrogenase-12
VFHRRVIFHHTDASVFQVLLTKNAKVYIACRDKAKGEAVRVVGELKEVTGKEAIFLQLDLANLKSIKAAAEEFLR